MPVMGPRTYASAPATLAARPVLDVVMLDGLVMWDLQDGERGRPARIDAAHSPGTLTAPAQCVSRSVCERVSPPSARIAVTIHRNESPSPRASRGTTNDESARVAPATMRPDGVNSSTR